MEQEALPKPALLSGVNHKLAARKANASNCGLPLNKRVFL